MPLTRTRLAIGSYHGRMPDRMPDRMPVDVVVVGGGVIGLSAAWQAAMAGLSVTVVDPHPGRGATWAAAGMLGPVGEAHFGEERLARANVAAAEAWPAFAQSLEAAAGQEIGYTTTGTVLAAVDGSDRAALDDLLGFQQSLGLRARRLSARDCRGIEPLLAPGIRGGAEFPGDHHVDNRRLIGALDSACAAAGVTVVREEVTSVTAVGGRASGVSFPGGRLSCGAVVLAAGCRSGQIDGIPDAARPPVRPVKGLTLRVRAPSGGPVLRQTVRGLVHGMSCYLVPRADGTVVIGATVEEKGFDLTVQVGAVHDLLRDARTLVPALDEYEWFDTTTGLRPGSPDNAPIVGAAAMDGLIVATGHYRNGILLAPLTADAVVAVLCGDRVTGPMALFEPKRFGTATTPAPGVRIDSHR